MPQKPTVKNGTIATQADRRFLVTVFDQHKSPRFPNGRPWWGSAEFPSNPGEDPGIVGALMPGNHEDPFGSTWEAPWLPVYTVRYFAVNFQNRKVQIKYGVIRSDCQQATEKYYAATAVIAYEKEWEPPVVGGVVDHFYRAVLGPPPQSPKIPEAAQAGDPWLLGSTQEANDGLLAILKATQYGGSGVIIPPVAKAPLATPDDVLTMSKADLNALIAQAVGDALAAQRAPSDAKRQAMAKARAAKALKHAQAGAHAAPSGA